MLLGNIVTIKVHQRTCNLHGYCTRYSLMHLLHTNAKDVGDAVEVHEEDVHHESRCR